MDLSDFLVNQDAILLDGAMGTQLAVHGLNMGGQNNLTNPDQVLSIHKEYSQCGCCGTSPERIQAIAHALSCRSFTQG